MLPRSIRGGALVTGFEWLIEHARKHARGGGDGTCEPTCAAAVTFVAESSNLSDWPPGILRYSPAELRARWVAVSFGWERGEGGEMRDE